MKVKDFEKLLDERVEKIRSTLTKKSAEYADGSDDKLYNFKRAARISGDTVQKTLAGMMLKHEVSVWDIIDEKRPFTIEMIDEKIGDMINYLILLEAVLKEILQGKKEYKVHTGVANIFKDIPAAPLKKSRYSPECCSWCKNLGILCGTCKNDDNYELI
jgi:hypothetical protein